jgi:hypothetical protein
MPNGDYLLVSTLNVGSLFSGVDGSFISYFLNPTGSNTILNNPGGILYGPDGNLWVSSKGLNRVTRFNPTTGAKIDDIISGGLLNNGPNEMRIEGNWLYIAGGQANNIVRYNLTNLATINSSGEVFVPDTAGLTNVEHILFADINDLPVALAGADATVVAGQPFTLDGSASSDPENVPLAFTWTQLSGTPVSGLPANTATVPLTAPPAPSVLVFQLSVSDGVRSATDTIQITVTAPDAQLEAPENSVLADGSGALAFGTVALGQNATLSVTVRNTGNAPLTATTPDFTGAHKDDFTYDPTGFDPTLDPGQSSTFILRFTPAAAGDRFATFRFRSNDPDEDPYEIALSGTGNTPPTYPGFSAVAAHNTPLVLSRNKLTAFASDADGDAVTITAVSPTSAQGGSVVLAATTVTYTPPTNYSGNDSFTLTLTDARGATAPGTVSLTVDPPATGGGTGSNPAQITVRPDGKVDVKFQGIPNRNYRIQRSINMTTWENIGQTTASPTGQVTYLDENPPVPNGFYRIARF